MFATVPGTKCDNTKAIMLCVPYLFRMIEVTLDKLPASYPPVRSKRPDRKAGAIAFTRAGRTALNTLHAFREIAKRGRPVV